MSQACIHDQAASSQRHKKCPKWISQTWHVLHGMNARLWISCVTTATESTQHQSTQEPKQWQSVVCNPCHAQIRKSRSKLVFSMGNKQKKLFPNFHTKKLRTWWFCPICTPFPWNVVVVSELWGCLVVKIQILNVLYNKANDNMLQACLQHLRATTLNL